MDATNLLQGPRPGQAERGNPPRRRRRADKKRAGWLRPVKGILFRERRSYWPMLGQIWSAYFTYSSFAIPPIFVLSLYSLENSVLDGMPP